MVDSKNVDMQIYDIYDVLCTPWWQQAWFLGILGILCIFLGFLCFFVYKKYGQKKSLPVDFFVEAQKELSVYKEMVETTPDKIDTHELYTALISMFKRAYFTYTHIDFFTKTGTDLKEALQSQGVHDQEMYDFLDTAENVRFSKGSSIDLALNHIEYMQKFLIKIAQHKAGK